MIEHARIGVSMADGRARADLDDNIEFRLAAERAVEIVGEAASRVTSETKGSMSGLPWREIIATRNIIVHGYGAIDRDILWRILTVHLPELIDLLAAEGIDDTDREE